MEVASFILIFAQFLLVVLSMSTLNPESRKVSEHRDAICVVHWNARGVNSKVDLIQNFLDTNNVDLLLIQESLLPNNTKLNFKNHFAISKCEGTNPGNGLLIIHSVRHGCIIHSIKNTPQIQSVTVEFFINKKVRVYVTNFYRKFIKLENLDSVSSQLYSIDLTLPEHLILGDFNLTNHRHVLNKFLLDTKVQIHSDLEIPTRPISGTCPDLTLSCETKKLSLIDWYIHDNNMNSDHLPVVSEWGLSNNTKQNGHNTIQHTMQFNVKKANWELFRTLDRATHWETCHDQNTDIFLQNYTSKIHEIAKKSIPNTQNLETKIPHRAKRSVPWWDDEINIAKQEKIAALKEFRQNREEESWEKY